jgi:hypothetical protein
MDSVGLRLQGLDLGEQIVALARLVQMRNGGKPFWPADVDALFDDVGLPRPAKTSNILVRLERAKPQLLTRRKTKTGPPWILTPAGKARATALMSDMDAAALQAEAQAGVGVALGNTVHPVVPAHLAPPDLLAPVRAFLVDHPFENNVFGMTRFPSESDDEDAEDPVAPALRVARDVCAAHGLELHLASDRQIVDDLWGNVAAHMWACSYGIGFFEDQAERGLNYNLTIEVGSMLVLGRRTALLKDRSIDRMPTDLVGRIYHDVDLTDPSTVEKAVKTWIKTALHR